MKILLVKLSSLGDVIQTVPVIHDIQQALPGAQIDWVVEEAFAPLVERADGLRRVWAIAERRWRKARLHPATRQERAAFFANLQIERYDAVIDFQGLIKSALVARQAQLTPGGFRATYANGSDACSYEWPVRFMVNKAVPMARRIHAVARYRTLAAQALGYELQGEAVYRWTGLPASSTQDAARTVVLAHGTTRPDNEWPQADWIALGRRLVEAGWQVALPQAGAQELAFANQLAEAMGSAAQVWPKMDLAQVLDHMAASAGVVGVDSGLSHLAVALNLPHVQIFSQPRAWRAGPVGQAHQRAVGGEHAPDIETVWQCWQEVWRASGADRPMTAMKVPR